MRSILIILSSLLLVSPLYAEVAATLAEPNLEQAEQVQALVQDRSAQGIQTLLLAAQRIHEDTQRYAVNSPIVLVLNGAEIEFFTRTQYRENKVLVDLAARLSAFDFVRIEVSQRYLTAHNIAAQALPSFVQLVEDGNAQIQHLQQQGYATLRVENPA